MHVKKGDMVQVISGNDKGKTGEVVQAMPKNGRVVVQGINMRWRHKKPTQQNPKGERVEVESSIHHSNVKAIETAKKAKKS
jgi:large subunit ribosomal protein L24